MLKNKINNQLIIEKTRIASSFFSRFKGLMLETKQDYALIFVLEKETIIGASIHMMFVFFPIDIIYLNKDKKVIKIMKRILPFTLFITPVKCKYIIELKNSKTLQLNDKISFK